MRRAITWDSALPTTLRYLCANKFNYEFAYKGLSDHCHWEKHGPPIVLNPKMLSALVWFHARSM